MGRVRADHRSRRLRRLFLGLVSYDDFLGLEVMYDVRVPGYVLSFEQGVRLVFEFIDRPVGIANDHIQYYLSGRLHTYSKAAVY